MKKSSTITVVICGLAAMFATVVFYLLAFDNIFTIPIRWLSLTGLLIVEIIGTTKALTVNKSILGVAQIITGGLHLLAALVLSIVFVNLFPFLIREYILISLLLLIAVAVIDVLLLYFNGKAHDAHQKHAESAAVIDACEAQARKLLVENAEAEFGSQLKTVVEMLTYANRGMACSNDNELLTKINEIAVLVSDGETEKIFDAIKQVQNLLQIRKELTKKTGKF